MNWRNIMRYNPIFLIKGLKILFFLPLLFSCQTEKVASSYPKFVGDISYDKTIDGDFKKCGENQNFSFQYYHSNGFQYKGEKFEIFQELKSKNISGNKDANGYITIRFIVNCEGKSGMFRTQQMGLDYKQTQLDNNLTNKLLDFTKSLRGWIPRQNEGQKIDYYQYLTYKIENGQVVEILP